MKERMFQMKKLTKRLLAALLATALLTAALAGCGGKTPSNSAQSNAGSGSTSDSTPSSGPLTVRISAGPSGANNFMICAALGDKVMSLFSDYTISAEISTGSAQNIRAMSQNEAQMGIAMSDSALYAYNAEREFTDLEPKQFNYVIGGYQTIVHIMVPADSSIQSVADLKGKKVAASQGITAQYYLPIVLEAYGMTTEDVTVSELQLNDVVNALNDGTVDVGFHITSYPLAAISDLAATKGLRLLSLPDDIIDAIAKDYPYFSKMVIDGGAYPGIPEDTVTIGTLNTLICRADLDEEFVYNFVKTVCESTEDLAAVHPKAGDFNKDNTLTGAVIPIHPGAERYYKEIGIL